MRYYEVFSPSRKQGAKDIGLTLEAPNWMAALKAFLISLGEDPDELSGMMCDAQDNVRFHLTFPNSNRWFRIVEVQRDAPVDIHIGDLDVQGSEGTITGHDLRLEQRTEDALAPTPAPETTDPLFTLSSTAVQKTPTPTPADDAHIDDATPLLQRPPLDEILEKIFARSTDLMEGQIDPDLVVTMFLDLALDLIASEAGVLYVADISSHELSYAALRSPRAQKVLASGKKIRMGEGMAGLSAQEGRTLCFDEIKRFPDYFEEAAFLTGLEPRNALCVALEHEARSYGAIQLVNRLMIDRFEADDIAILEAIGEQVATLLARV